MGGLHRQLVCGDGVTADASGNCKEIPIYYDAIHVRNLAFARIKTTEREKQETQKKKMQRSTRVLSPISKRIFFPLLGTVVLFLERPTITGVHS